jgi:hypothetical protein
MGVDTKAILRKGTTIQEIEKALSTKYENVEVRASQPDFMQITFKDGEDRRTLSVLFGDYAKADYGIDGVLISLGMHGNSVEICKYLCETFGGYLDENDCDDKDFYPINYHLYSQSKEFTKLDEFKHKVISELGYDKLQTTLKLLDEYSELTKNV